MPGENSIFNKLRWQVAAKLPGPGTWDKMKLVGKGLAPLNQTQMEQDTIPPQAVANPFLRNVYNRAFAQAGLPVPPQKQAALPTGTLAAFWRSLRGTGAASRSASSLGKRLGTGTGRGWNNLFRESGQGGAYNGMTGQFGPAIGRALGGSWLGHQFDSSDENATPWGSLVGGTVGLASPALLRRSFGNRFAAKNTLSKLFADRTVSRRLVNDPLNRVALSAATGNLIDTGAGALGYETGGWGERIGIAGGLAGGARPLAQALAGRYRSVDTALGSLKKIPMLGKGFQKAQRENFTHLPAYLLGSPYATGTGAAATVGMMTHGAIDATLGDRVRNLAEKKKMLAESVNGPEMEPIKKRLTEMLHGVFGPGANLYDPDGTPSKETILLVRELGRHGIMQVQKASQNYFGDRNYMLRPDNWERLSSPLTTMGDILKGQVRRFQSQESIPATNR